MAIDGFAFTTIANTRVDPDSPLDTALVTDIRDALENLMRWIGRDFLAGQIANHDHDNVNSAFVSGASGGVGLGLGYYKGSGAAGHRQDLYELEAEATLIYNISANAASTIDSPFMVDDAFRTFNGTGQSVTSANGPLRDDIELGGFNFSGVASFVNTTNEAYAAQGLKSLAGVMEVGSYFGDVSTNQSIVLADSTIGPGFVLIVSLSAVALGAHARGLGSTSFNSVNVQAGTIITTGIRSLDSNGFTVGSTLNVNGDKYLYIAMQTGSSAGEAIKIVNYQGNGAIRTLTGATGTGGFRPDCAWILGEEVAGRTLNCGFTMAQPQGRTVHWDSTTATTGDIGLDRQAGLGAGWVADGVGISAAADVNNSSDEYTVVFFKHHGRRGFNAAA